MCRRHLYDCKETIVHICITLKLKFVSDIKQEYIKARLAAFWPPDEL